MTGNHVFSDLMVMDFTTTLVGPSATRVLADYGATVIKIETSAHADVLRTNQPFINNEPGVNRSGYFANYNAGKYSLTLNLSLQKARELALRLAKDSDVLVESFRPGVMKKWGLNYEEVIKVNPSIIMVSTNLMGQYGPQCMFRGYGHHGAALAGWGTSIGWPDREPILPFGAYTDYLAARYVAIGILSALEYRRRTGRGQHIDNSQVECSIDFLATSILDYKANRRVMKADGNHDSAASPHGAYRCQGEDRWVAIAVTSDEEWLSFCKIIDAQQLSKDPRFATLNDRKKNEEQLDRLVEEWTKEHLAEQVVKLMQQEGISAAIVENSVDISRDPQLEYRNHFKVMEHPEIGHYAYQNFGFRLSKSPGEPRSPDPCLGDHNYFVCTDIMGLSDLEFTQLSNEGVFE